MPRGTRVGIYRSKLEQRVDKQLKELKLDVEYEPPDKKIRYTHPATGHIYTPDYVIRKPDGGLIYVEAKGIWDYRDRYKHLLIKQQYPEYDIRFIFQRARQRIRKGSKTTYRDICEGHGRGIFKGITWQFSDNGIVPKEWFT